LQQISSRDLLLCVSKLKARKKPKTGSLEISADCWGKVIGNDLRLLALEAVRSGSKVRLTVTATRPSPNNWFERQ
jgi:hypothetical protein